jgi:acyl-CoA synthetase (AMP-forming)/AMP-acid ligase II
MWKTPVPNGTSNLLSAMIPVDNRSTLAAVLKEAATRNPTNNLIAVPPRNGPGGGAAEGQGITYAAVHEEVTRLMESYARAGYGRGHRVGFLLDNTPEHLLHKLALNSLGSCCVPLNPDLRSGEQAYLVDHARVDLVLALPHRRPQLEQALVQAVHRPDVAVLEVGAFDQELPRPKQIASSQTAADSAGSILYTSGTTGRSKGSVLSNSYELAAGAAHAARGGLATIREGQEQLYNPLPLYHVNASILSFTCMLLTGNCQVQGERFHPLRFWDDVRATRATVVHYLDVMIPMLLQQPPRSSDREHDVRFGFGAGVEPQLHAAFEARFGFPLIEIWGMTEMVRVLADAEPSRRTGTRAFGRPLPDVEVRVVDDDHRDQPPGVPGEMLIRHSEQTPRRHFFSGYLDDPEATEHAWRGGRFHTGDVVTRDEDGVLHFVDRRKNIIRRSGENIASAEIEAHLLSHELVSQVAVFAVPDEVREEEVFVCVVPKDPALLQPERRFAAAEALQQDCLKHLAYYKAPGYLLFTSTLPTTGTQKVQKHTILERGVDPRVVTVWWTCARTSVATDLTRLPHPAASLLPPRPIL